MMTMQNIYDLAVIGRRAESLAQLPPRRGRSAILPSHGEVRTVGVLEAFLHLLDNDVAGGTRSTQQNCGRSTAPTHLPGRQVRGSQTKER